jgi:exopolysaccharide biosynthesis WecB/TagA/CpsF family protein
MIFSLLAIIFAPRWARSVVKEKISGSELIWSLADVASRENKSIFLLGGFADTAEKVKNRLEEKYPNLKIAGTYSGNPSEQGMVEKINSVKPDILLVAFGQIRQEKWIAKHLEKLGCKVAIGVGGTFDYVAEIRLFAPRILRHIGLEWAFRLITQPSRIKRIFDAVFVFCWYMLLHKIQILKPYRKNVLACVVNEKNEIFLGHRAHRRFDKQFSGASVLTEHWQFPQGGIDRNEDPDVAVHREVFEETGLKNLEILGKIPNAHKFDWTVRLSFVTYGARYRGQSQSFYFLRSNSTDEIKLDTRELDKYKWIKKEELLSTIHPLRKNIANIILQNFDKYVN